MKLVKAILILIIVSALVAFITTCKRDANKQMADAQENVVKANQDVKDAAAALTWEQYRADANARISLNETTIADYKAMNLDTNGRFKASYDKKIEALEVKNHDLKVKLNNYKDDGKSSWEKFKSELDKDIETLGTAIKGFTVNNKK